MYSFNVTTAHSLQFLLYFSFGSVVIIVIMMTVRRTVTSVMISTAAATVSMRMSLRRLRTSS